MVCDICGEHVIDRYIRRHKLSKHDPHYKDREALKRKEKIAERGGALFQCSQVWLKAKDENKDFCHVVGKIHRAEFQY